MPEIPTVGPGALLAVLALVLLFPAGAYFVFQADGDVSEATVEGEPTIVAKAHDADGDGEAGWIELVLLEDPERTYEPSTLHVELVPPQGETVVEHDDPLPYVRDKIVCTEPVAQRGVREATRACRTGADSVGGASWFDAEDPWGTGEALFVPCQVVGGLGVEVPDGGSDEAPVAGGGVVEDVTGGVGDGARGSGGANDAGEGGDEIARVGEDSGPHEVRVSIRSELLLAQTVPCAQAAPLGLVSGSGR